MVVPVELYPLSANRCALESPFADHLRTLRSMLSDEITELVVAGLEMPGDRYAKNASHLGELDVERDGVRFLPLAPGEIRRARFWLQHAPRVAWRLAREVARSRVVHAGPSHDLWLPIEFPALALGAAMGRTTISITDIDNRESARMMTETGRWSRRTYLVTKYLYDPLRDLQHQAIVRMCSLVLFKGDQLWEDYGQGRPHVHTYCDPGFEDKHIADDAFLAEKSGRLRDIDRPVELVYFGRYVYYKGVHHLLDALKRVSSESLRLNLMGAGPEETALRKQVNDLGLEQRVIFHEPVRYGDEFFDKVREFDLMLAAPLGVDTPRSAWDAFAAALPILAYDTEFYRGLSRQTGAVDVVPWNEPESMAAQMKHYANNREALVRRTEAAVQAARSNTQSHWLEQRVSWTRTALRSA